MIYFQRRKYSDLDWSYSRLHCAICAGTVLSLFCTCFHDTVTIFTYTQNETGQGVYTEAVERDPGRGTKICDFPYPISDQTLTLFRLLKHLRTSINSQR